MTNKKIAFGATFAKDRVFTTPTLLIVWPILSVIFCLFETKMTLGWMVVRCCFQLKTFQTRLITSQKHIIYTVEFVILFILQN